MRVSLVNGIDTFYTVKTGTFIFRTDTSPDWCRPSIIDLTDYYLVDKWEVVYSKHRNAIYLNMNRVKLFLLNH